jgi:hypothetical protein
MAKYEVEYVHHLILLDAEDIANQELALASANNVDLSDYFGTSQIFKADPLLSEKGGLCLSVDPIHTMGRSPEVLSILHEIGRKAIRKSLLKNQEQFVGLILGHARLGENYFSRFPDEHGQFKMF